MTYQTDEEVREAFEKLIHGYHGVEGEMVEPDEFFFNQEKMLDFILTLRKNDRAVKYGEGYKQGKFDAQMEGCDCEEKIKEWLKNEVGKMKREDPGDFGAPSDKLIREQWWGREVALKNVLSLLEPKTDV